MCPVDESISVTMNAFGKKAIGRVKICISILILVISCNDPETDYDAICASLEPTGSGLGDVAENWTIEDADGVARNLHDFCGKVVYLKIGAQW